MARFQREKGINLSRAVRIGCQAVGFAGRTSVHLATGILAGTAATINTAAGAINDVCHGRTEKALDRVGRRVDQVVAGFGQALDGTAQLVEDAAKAPSPEAFCQTARTPAARPSSRRSGSGRWRARVCSTARATPMWTLT